MQTMSKEERDAFDHKSYRESCDVNKQTDFDLGYRHGADGIRFHVGNWIRDFRAYERGYILGRELWKQEFGRYPSSGDTSYDLK